MRDIEFRGKLRLNGMWIYGGIYTKDGLTFIHDKKHGFTVNPETVGQYTGLQGKNGVKVYEGDIIRLKERYKDTALGDDYFQDSILTGQILFDTGSFWFSGSGRSIHHWHFFNYEDIEVIGNIHDRPELLEVKK